MGKTKATNFLRLIAFGLVIILLYYEIHPQRIELRLIVNPNIFEALQ